MTGWRSPSTTSVSNPSICTTYSRMVGASLSTRPSSTARVGAHPVADVGRPRSVARARAPSSAGVTSMLDPGATPVRSAAASSRTASPVARLPDGPTQTPTGTSAPSISPTSRSRSPSDTTAPPLSSWRTSARRRRPRRGRSGPRRSPRGRGRSGRRPRPRPRGPSPPRGRPGRRPGEASATAASAAPSPAARRHRRRGRADRGPSGFASPRTPRSGGGRRALWILNSSSLHLGWSSWPGRAGSARRRSAPRWLAPPPSPVCRP